MRARVDLDELDWLLLTMPFAGVAHARADGTTASFGPAHAQALAAELRAARAAVGALRNGRGGCPCDSPVCKALAAYDQAAR